MSLRSRGTSRTLAGLGAAIVAALFIAACSDGPAAVGAASKLAPTSGPSRGLAFPLRCTTLATCTGTVTNDPPGTLRPEVMRVCKRYPAGTVNAPAVQVKVDVAESPANKANFPLSPTNFVVTVQPNTCVEVWHNGEDLGPDADTVTVTEIVPAGYLATSQVITTIRVGPRIGATFPANYNTVTAAPTSATSYTAIIGGAQIPGAEVVFTNTPAGSVGDFVFNDANANGIQDAGENGVAGVTLTLTQTGQTAVTNASGNYSFGALPLGSYSVTITPPAGYAITTPATRTATLTVASPTDVTLDFGVYQPGSIGDFVWDDKNGNGVQDAGEPGIPGVTVSLSNGALTTTSASGAYGFSNLAPASYTVTVATPAGYVAAPTGAGTPTTDNNGSGTTVAVAAGTSDASIDFGFYTPASIGDFVWSDVNGNGVQDAGEPGIAGVVVTLSTGATATTNASGLYTFVNVKPGTYTVSVATPAGYLASPTGAGATATDNNGSGTSVTVTSGSTDNTIDFGFYKQATIGDFVWNDKNGNGVQDAGELGIAGVTVSLSNGGGSTVTNASGAYSFAVKPGTYVVTVGTPSGYTVSPTGAGTAATDNNGSGTSVTVASGATDNTIDFGFHKLGSIGDFVWKDLNGNGIQDAGEPGLAGVTVTLSSGPSTTTSASGAYAFANLTPGTYTVTVGTPAGYTAAPTGAGTAATDNNGSGTSVTIAGNSDTTIDFGFVLIPVVSGKACTYTQGYWKNHEDVWPAPYSPTAQWLTPQKKVAGMTWDDLFGTAPKGGNSYVQLAHQWMAATLNRTQGAPASANVQSVLNAAGAWLLANTPTSGTLPSIKNAQADSWMSTLDDYNNGNLGTPHCN